MTTTEERLMFKAANPRKKIELAISWLEHKVNSVQLAEMWSITPQHVPYKVAHILRFAIRYGFITMKVKK